MTGTERHKGAVLDTDYQEWADVFICKENFMNKCTDDCKDIPFLNVTDEQYLCVLAAWHAEKQLLFQPSFAHTDKHYGTEEVLCLTTVTSHKSSNERVDMLQSILVLFKEG